MNRFATLKIKILLLVFGVLLSLGAFLTFLSKNAIESALYRAEQKASRDALYLVYLDITNQHQDLLYHNSTVLETRKRNMKDLTGSVLSLIDGFYQAYQNGLLTETNAKRMALEQVKTFRYGNADYFFIYDENFNAISHPDPSFMGRMLKDYEDAKGKLIIQELMKKSQHPGGGFEEYWWKRLNESEPMRKIGYAIFYPKWKWMVGTGLYLDDIDKEYQKKLSSMLNKIKTTFDRLRAAEKSEFFLFNGKKEILIRSAFPEDETKLTSFMTAAQHPGDLSRYRSAEGIWRQSYVAHFQPLDWYIVNTVDEDALQRPGKTLFRNALTLVFSLLTISLLIAYLIASRIARPIGQLTTYARNLVSQQFHPQTMVERLAARPDETGKLAEAFSFMQTKLQEYIRNLKESTAAKERMESELRIAREIQMSMLPKKFADSSPSRNFSIYGCLEPAREVGGDFYDYFYVDDKHFCVTIGDVCDKGIPASLFMAASKTLIRSIITTIRSYTAEGAPPHEILKRVNTELNRENEKCMFVTIFLGLVNLENGEMLYSNAGHNFPFIISANEPMLMDHLPASPAGIKANQDYKSSSIHLAPDDTLCLYTDGIPEANNESGRHFTIDRLRGCLLAAPNQDVEELATRILQDITDFRGNCPQNDDITLLLFKYHGPKCVSPAVGTINQSS